MADDDVRNIFSLTKALEQHKMKVLSAMDGKEALMSAEGNPVDIVLMDMMMPEMDGFEAISRLRKMLGSGIFPSSPSRRRQWPVTGKNVSRRVRPIIFQNRWISTSCCRYCGYGYMRNSHGKKSVIRFEDVELLLNDLYDRYGYDFTEYSKASLVRRIQRLFTMDMFPSFAEFRYRLQTDTQYFRRFVEEITVNVTEMLRDPSFYRTVRTAILPVLATYPFIRIWHAGCSTGEEVYSMAILLKEAGLLHKSLLYGTDINPQVIEKARKGIFPGQPDAEIFGELYPVRRS